MDRFAICIILACFLVIPSPSKAQGIFHGGMYGTMGMPTAEMKRSIFGEKNFPGLGGGFNVLVNPKGRGLFSPVHLGAEFNYIYLGKEKIDASPTYPPLKTNYNFVTVGPIIRYFPFEKEEGFTPFFDGGFGWKILSTSTQFDDTLLETIINGEEAVQLMSTKFGGIGLNLGVGFFNRQLPKEGEPNTASFYMKILYQYGDTINFVERGSIKVDNLGNFSYQTGRTKTSMIILQIGLALH